MDHRLNEPERGCKTNLGERLKKGKVYMKIHTYLLALAPFVLGGCVVSEPVPVASTTTVTREVTTTTPGYREVATAPGYREVIVTQAPPPVRVETQTVAPGGGYVWSNGHWRWTGVGYRWVAGNWVARPTARATYVQGDWVRRGDGWVWVDPRWM